MSEERTETAEQGSRREYSKKIDELISKFTSQDGLIDNFANVVDIKDFEIDDEEIKRKTGRRW